MNDVINLISAVLEGGWDMLSNIKIPGLDFPVAALLVGLFLFSLGFRLMSFVMGWHFDSGAISMLANHSRSSGQGYGSSSGGHVNVSDARKNDEF